jgi:hypothetical protein
VQEINVARMLYVWGVSQDFKSPKFMICEISKIQKDKYCTISLCGFFWNEYIEVEKFVVMGDW